jgi:hypothetical protein
MNPLVILESDRVRVDIRVRLDRPLFAVQTLCIYHRRLDQ